MQVLKPIDGAKERKVFVSWTIQYQGKGFNSWTNDGKNSAPAQIYDKLQKLSRFGKSQLLKEISQLSEKIRIFRKIRTFFSKNSS